MSGQSIERPLSGEPGPPGAREEGRPRRLALRLALVTAAMFGFGYALVPLYNAVCAITGINGRTTVVAESEVSGKADATRNVEVQFLTTVIVVPIEKFLRGCT